MPNVKFYNRISQILPVFVVVNLGLILQVRGYPKGAPEGVCDDMIPHHGVGANKSAPPYVITLSSKSYSPNQKISVTIEGKSGAVFEGFMLAARHNGNIENFGRFIPVSKTHGLTCSNKNDSAITHSDNSERTNLTFTWEAPATNVGDLEMTATIVRSKLIFWLNVTSEVLQPSFQSSAAASTLTTTPPPGMNEIQCKSKKCQIQWKMNKDAGVTSFNFSLESLNVNMYISLGLSHDRKMGNDSVMECLRYPNGSILAQLSYNDGHANALVPSESVKLTSGSFENGWMKCSFTRKNMVNNPNIFNFEGNEWYLLVAIGEVNTNKARQKDFHSIKFALETKIDLSKSEGLFDESSDTEILHSVHGSLMIFAWVFFASVGMFTCRYFKSINKRIKGVALWFLLHGISMVLTLLLTVIGFIIIFTEEGGYSESVGLPYDAHPVLGIIVTILTVINPIMAYFRPDIDSSKRVWFNLAHRSVGVISFILADATLFLGIFLFHKSTYVAKSSIAVLSIFLIYKCIAVVTMEILEIWKERTAGSIELTAPGENKTTEESYFGFSKTILLICHISITFVLSVLLIIFLNIGI